MGRFFLSIGLLSMVLGLPQSAGAQAQAAKWSVSLVTGTTSSGPAKDVEQAMRASGFDANPPCLFSCQGSTERPKSTTGWGQIGFPWMAEAKYRHSRRLGAAVTVAKSAIGTTIGYREADEGFGDFLFVNYAVHHAAVAGVLSLGPLHIKAGPAIYQAVSWRDEPDTENANRHAETSVGLNYGAGLSIPLWRRVSAEARYDYRAVGSARMGPFTAGRSTAPETRGDFSHWYGGGGISVRF